MGSTAVEGRTGIPGLISERARRNPGAAAIATPGRRALSYGDLLRLVADAAGTLNGLGLGRNDRIALVLPNGPESAAAFLAVASAATCVPLNPAYRENEFEQCLADLGAKALIAQEGAGDSPAAAARRRGIPVVTLSPVPDAGAGTFRLAGGGIAPRRDDGPAAPGDIALVLQTSGTLSRPNVVPLTHSNLLASADGIRETLRLGESDRCLNVMPLFHIHGLAGALLSSISAGACVVCPGPFDPGRFFGWVEEFRPTWYTAVPAIHQSVLSAASSADPGILSGFPMRFIRSCSAALPRRLGEELEATFRVPVIEAYGMTEASHQITSNPLPPGIRKPGSVGVAAGPEVAVLDEAGNPLGPGETGEVAIRGKSVTAGYENAAGANRRAIVDGWFRTGDQGYLDGDGYLFLTGRLKEIVNRGGLKVSPREIDDALLEHPKVAQAAAFGIRHATLGEDIVAAVVPREGDPVSEREIREFALSRLTEYKVPSRVLIVDKIPKGPTGKLRRTELAETLKHLLEVDFVAPRDDVEDRLKAVWQRVLGAGTIGIRDNFFDLGGNSLLAVQMFARVGEIFGRSLPLSALFHAPTIGELAAMIRGGEASGRESSLVPIQPAGSRPPFYCVYLHDGDALWIRDLAFHVGTDQPFYGLQPKIPEDVRSYDTYVEDMAKVYVEDVRKMQPEGPYFLGGNCLGGAVAIAMARRLLATGERVAFLGLIFAYAPGYPRPRRGGNPLWRGYYEVLTGIDRVRTTLPGVEPSGRGRYLWKTAKYALGGFRGYLSRLYYTLFSRYGDSYLKRQQDHVRRVGERIRAAGIGPYPGRLTLFRMEKEHLRFFPDGDCGWGKIARGGLDVQVMPGYLEGYHFDPCLRDLSAKLRACLSKARTDGP